MSVLNSCSAISFDTSVTQLLNQWTHGNKQALDDVLPMIYADLRKMAQAQIRHEGAIATLCTTSLIHELYMELVVSKNVHFENRYQFFGFAAKVMRHVLVRHARNRKAQKRGGGQQIEDFHEEKISCGNQMLSPEELLALEQAITTLGKVDQRQSQMVELRFFAGLSLVEIAEAMSVSQRTVKRELRTAKLWLSRTFQKKKGLREVPL